MEKEDKVNLVNEIQERLEQLNDNVVGKPEGLMVRGLMTSTGALGTYYERFYPTNTMTILKKE